MDYHVKGTMLKHYQTHMPKLANIMAILSMTHNYFLNEFNDKAIVSFCNRFQSCVGATGVH